MTALAFDFTYEELAARPALREVPARGAAAPEVEAVPQPRRRLYAVRGTVDARAASAPPVPARVASRPAATPTLDAILGGAWSALATGFAECPVCHEETMTARWTAGHGLAGGRCASCRSTLD